MAFSLFNFGVGLQGQDSASGVFDGVQARVSDLREATNAYAATATRAFDGVGDAIERRATAALRSFGENFSGLRGDLQEISSALTFDMGSSFNEQALTLTDTTKKLAVQFGEGDEKARMFTNDIVEMSALTGQSIDVFSNLATSLAKAGIDISELSRTTRVLTDDGQTLQTVWGEQEYLATLIDAFGVAGDEAAEFAKGSKLLGLSINDTLDEVTTFQRNFRMPGMLEQVPEAAQSAIRSISEFGTEIAGESKDIVANTLQMGAVFAKTFGRSMRESVQEAARTMQQFNQEQLGLRKIAVGLATDFSPMITSFLETGESLDLVRHKLRQAATDRFGPIRFAEYVRGVYERLENAGQGLQAERFLIQMREQAPEAARSLIAIPGALEAARKEMERVVRFEQNNKGLKTFQEIGTQMWDTGKVAIDVFKNLVTLSKTLVGIMFEPVAKEIFGGVGNDLKSFNDRLADLVKRVNDADGVFQKKWKPTLVATGKVILAIGTGATLAASAVGTLATAFTIKAGVTKSWGLLARIVPGLGTAGSRTLGIFKGGTKIVGALGKKILLPLMAVKSLVTGLRDMASILKDPEASGAEKFGAIMRGLAVGVTDFVDDLLFGIPSKLANYFFPELGDSLEQGVGDLFDRAWSRITNLFTEENLDVARQWLSDVFARGAEWLSEFDISGSVQGITRDVTTALVGIAKFGAETVWDVTVAVFTGLGRWIKGWFSDEVVEPLDDESSALWDNFKNFAWQALIKLAEVGHGILRGMWEGITNAAGYHVDYVNGQFENMWLEAKLGFKGYMKSWSDGFDHLEVAWTKFKYSFGLFVPWLKKIGGSAWAGFANAATNAFNTAVIKGSDALQFLLKKISSALSYIDPFDIMVGKLAAAEGKLLDVEISRRKAQREANKEYKKELHDLQVAYDKASEPLNKAINKINDATAQRQKTYQAEVDAIHRQINQNDLLGAKAQDAYQKGLKAEKQERRAASAFRARKAEEQRAQQKERTDAAARKKQGQFADLWRMANVHAQDRVRDLRTSLESSGRSGASVDKAVSEASIQELKRLTAFRRAIKSGDEAQVKAAFSRFMSPASEVASPARQVAGPSPVPEGFPRGRSYGDDTGSGMAPVASPVTAPAAAPLSNIVDSAGKTDRDVTDLVGRLRDASKEGRQNHKEMIGRLDKLIEVMEDFPKGRSGVDVKIELDREKLLRVSRKKLMGKMFQEQGVGG